MYGRPRPSVGKSGRRSPALTYCGWALGLLLLATVLLGFRTPEVRQAARSVSRRLTKGVAPDGTEVDRADIAASALLFKAYSESASTLRIEETSQLLLSALLAPPSEARDVLLKVQPAVRAFWNTTHAHDVADGVNSALDPTSLFVILNCRTAPYLTRLQSRSIEMEFDGAVRAIRSRIGPDGLYAIPHPLAASGAGSFVRTAHQAQAIAALRCASTTLQQPQLAVAAASLLRSLHFLYLDSPPSSGAAVDVASPPFLLAAVLSPKAAGSTSRLPFSGMTPVRPRPVDGSVAAGELDVAPSELAQLLLWLEPGDLPEALVARIAAHLVATLETPVGLAMSPQGAAAGGSGGWRVAPIDQAVVVLGATKHLDAAVAKARAAAMGGAPRKLAPPPRAAPAAAAAAVDSDSWDEDGLLAPADEDAPLGDGEPAPDSEEDEEDYYSGGQVVDNGPPTAELIRPGTGGPLVAILRALIEAATRVAPLLEQCEREASSRSLARDLAAAVAQALPSASPGDTRAAAARHAQLQDSDEAGGAGVAEVLPLLAAAAHRFTFPEVLTPLGASDVPLDPALAAPIIPAWTLLKDAAVSRLSHSRLGEVAGKVVAAARNSTGGTRQRLALLAGGNINNRTRAIGGQAQAAVSKLIQMVYPRRGLRVVRAPVAAAEGGSDGGAVVAVEHVVLEATLPGAAPVAQQKQQQGQNPIDELDGLGLRGKQQQRQKGADAAPDAPGGKAALQLRGAGHPLWLSTAVTSRLLRTVTEQARTMTSRRLAAARQAGGAGQGNNAALAPPLREGIRGAGDRLARLARYGLRRQRVVRPALDDTLLVLLDPLSGDAALGVPDRSLAALFTWLDPRARATAAVELDRQRQRLVQAGAAASRALSDAAPVVEGIPPVAGGAPVPPVPVFGLGTQAALQQLRDQQHAQPVPVPGPGNGLGVGDAFPDPDAIPAPQARPDAAPAAFKYPDLPAGGGGGGSSAEGGAGEEQPAVAFLPQANARPAPPPPEAAEELSDDSPAVPLLAPEKLRPEAPAGFDPAMPPPALAAGAAHAPAPAIAIPAVAASAVVNIVELFARVCPTDDDGSPAAVPYAQPWASQCCGEAMSSLVLKYADAPGAAAPVAEVPTFTCPARGWARAGGKPGASVSCAYVLNDYCDCAGGADESATAACADEPATLFFCPSGALAVVNGALVPPAGRAAPSQLPAAALKGKSPAELAAAGYIAASKVGDGVKDCAGGEDEASAGAVAA